MAAVLRPRAFPEAGTGCIPVPWLPRARPAAHWTQDWWKGSGPPEPLRRGDLACSGLASGGGASGAVPAGCDRALAAGAAGAAAAAGGPGGG